VRCPTNSSLSLRTGRDLTQRAQRFSQRHAEEILCVLCGILCVLLRLISFVFPLSAFSYKEHTAEKQQKDVTILDVYENAASVKVVASDWIDYLHMAKSNGRWVIVNVLWELKPQKK